MAIAWSSLQDTLRTWFLTNATSASLPPFLVDVIFSKQKGPQPAMPYGTLGFDGPIQEAGAPDEVLLVYNPANPAGQEVEQTVVGRREFVATLKVFAAKTTGTGTAQEFLENAVDALRKPSQRDVFNAAGLSVLDIGQIRNIGDLLEADWQAIAVVEVRFRVLDVVLDKVGYIATAPVAASYTGP